MNLAPSIVELLEKPMDRKEFLRHMGVGALLIVGLGFLVRSSNLFTSNKSQQLGVSGAYGMSPYGGRRT